MVTNQISGIRRYSEIANLKPHYFMRDGVWTVGGIYQPSPRGFFNLGNVNISAKQLAFVSHVVKLNQGISK